MLAGALHARLMQSLKALTILGIDGGPGYAGQEIQNVFQAIRYGCFLCF